MYGIVTEKNISFIVCSILLLLHKTIKEMIKLISTFLWENFKGYNFKFVFSQDWVNWKIL